MLSPVLSNLFYSLDFLTAFLQPASSALLFSSCISGSNTLPQFALRRMSETSLHKPQVSPARYAAPSAVVSVTKGRQIFLGGEADAPQGGAAGAPIAAHKLGHLVHHPEIIF